MRQAQTLNEAQFRRVLHYCRSRRHPVRDTTIFMVSFYAGLRAKEIAHLNWAMCLMKTGAVRSSSFLAWIKAKAGSDELCISISALRKALAKYAKSKCLRELDRPLFESQKGGHFSANTMCQLFLDIYKACGLKDASSHSGRRTYITRLANKGVGVRLLAELAGHSHISTTQRYIDVNSDQLSQAVELL